MDPSKDMLLVRNKNTNGFSNDISFQLGWLEGPKPSLSAAVLNLWVAVPFCGGGVNGPFTGLHIRYIHYIYKSNKITVMI